MKILKIAIGYPCLILGLLSTAFPQSGMSPRDIISRSVRAHGGDRLADWQTMTINGTVDMLDGIMFRAAYRVFAKSPGKLRVEKDMTVVKGGRAFYEYFLNDGVAWSRRNLVASGGNLQELTRWLNQCQGIAYYAGKAESLSPKEDAVVEWREKPDLQSNDYKVVASRPAYVIQAVIGKETTDLYIDKEQYYLLQEVSGRLKRISWDFRKFGEATLPSRVLEITTGGQGESFTPYTIESVKFNVPIQDWLFTEDMPKK